MASVLHWKKAIRLDLLIFKKIPGSIRFSIKDKGVPHKVSRNPFSPDEPP